MAVGSEGIRASRIRRTRDEMTDAAIRLFEERGFDAVTVEEIASAASVSSRTFFRYFGSKEAVLFSDTDEILAVLRSAISSRPRHEPPLDVLRHAVHALASYSADHRDRDLRRARLSQDGADIQAYQRSVLQPLYEEVLVDGIGAHLGVESSVDLRPRLFAGVAIGVLATVSEAWLASGGRRDVDEIVEQAFQQLLAALDAATVKNLSVETGYGDPGHE